METSEAKHTAGPWHTRENYEQKGDGIVAGIFTADEYIVAEICGGGSPLGLEGDRANANLIVVAPDLLEACQLAREAIISLMGEITNQRATNWGIVNDAMVKLDKVVVKVRGNTSEANHA